MITYILSIHFRKKRSFHFKGHTNIYLESGITEAQNHFDIKICLEFCFNNDRVAFQMMDLLILLVKFTQ